MIAALTLIALTLGAIPPELSAPMPGTLLRWPSLDLVDDRSGAASELLAPEKPLRFSVTGPAIVRLRGAFAEGCNPMVFRRSGDGPGWIDLPLTVAHDGADRLLELTPAVVPGIGNEETEKPALYRIELPPGCRRLPLKAFRAVAELDEFGALGLGIALRRWADSPPTVAELTELLAQPLPHRWQEEAGLAVALPHLLAAVPGNGRAAEELSRAWLEDAIADAQADELSFSFVSPLEASLPRVSIPGAPQPFYRLEAGQTWDAEVGSATLVRLFSRAPMEAAQPVAVQNVQIQFDDRPAVPWRSASSGDPELPSYGRQHSLALVIPPGAQHVRIRSTDPLFVRGLLVRRKVHLEDALSLKRASEHLTRAAAEDQPDLRSMLATAMARAQLGCSEPLQRLLGNPELRGTAAAIAALVASELSSDETSATALFARAEASLASADGKLERLASPLLEARILRARTRTLVSTDRSAEAVRRWLALAARRPLTSEDAAALAEADVFASEGLEGGAPALAVLDGLAALRPLDRELLVARSREYALATGWYSLGVEGSAQEAFFLEPPPQVRPVGSERFAYSRLPRGGAVLAVTVPLPPLPNRKPVLSFVVARGTALARVITVQLDGAPVALPALAPFERFDLPVEPGAHRVVLESSDFAGEVFCNYAAAPEPLYLRHYAEVGAKGLEWRSREIGSPGVAELAVRLAGPSGAPAPSELDVTLAGAGSTPIKLRLHPGPWRTEPTGELAAGNLVTEPLEVTLPVSEANVFHLSANPPEGVRLLARLSLRRHRPVVPPVINPEAVTGAGAALADAGAALGAVSTLTGQIAASRSAPVALIARAAALFELDELGLAREDLLAAVEDRSIGAHQRALVTALWRSLDAIGSDHPASVPSGVQHLAPSLLLATGHPDAIGIGLLALLDDPATLARFSPSDLRKRAGEGAAGDLAVMIAAQAAQQAGSAARAADLWMDLARAHPDLALLRRNAGAALMLSPEPKAAALAYLELSAACELEPRDAYAHRLLRQAAARTRLRPLKFADQSAGTRAVLIKGGEPTDPSVEEAMLPPAPASENASLLTAGRQAHLAFSLNAALMLTLRAQVVELRNREGSLLGAENLGIEYVRDGEPPKRFQCTAQGACGSEPIELLAGMHTLDVRLVGGLRPAGRLWADAKRAGAPQAPLASETFAASHLSDHLVARADEPIALLVHGPALLRIEARSGLGRQAARDSELTAETHGQPALSRSVTFAPTADPRATLDDRASLSPASVTVLALPAPAAYRVTLRPRSGELLARIAVRDIGAPQTSEPTPSLAYRSLTPPPAFPVPSLETPLLSHVVDGDPAPGLDWLGALELASRWTYEQFEPAGVQVQPTHALATSFAYRRLLDSGFLTLKLAGDLRIRSLGSPSQWLGVEAFFMHPALRSIRAQLTLDGYTQPVGDVRAWSGALGTMIEPVLTLTSGLHLVTKVGVRLSALTLRNPPDSLLPTIDSSVYNRFASSHPRSLFWEEGLETEPLANVVLYANARLTTNPSLSPLNPDHVSATILARALFGRTYAEAALRSSWFFVDDDRPDPSVHPTLFVSLFHTLWLSSRQHVELGASGAYHFHTKTPEISVFIAWEGSNGRRFRDHTPLEGEDYFFPQRGPGPEGGRLEVRQ
ncbi:MAG TPA: hypothetical protein VGK67_23765 [Myxococcales bacterium]|jgi:hypothetical protein